MKDKPKQVPLQASSNGLFYLYSALLAIIGFFIFQYVFDKKISLTGDATDYYMLGKAIAQGDGYVGILGPERVPANHFPPGYPFVIAIIMKIFSDKTTTIQAVNGFFLIASVLLMFDLFRRMSRNIHLAFVGALLVLLNFHILQYSSMMMSEMTYFFVSLLALWLFVRADLSKQAWKDPFFWGFIICTVFSYYVRQTGLMILAGVGLYLLIRQKWSHIGFMAIVFFAGIAPWQIRAAKLGGDSHFRDMQYNNPLRPEEGTVQNIGGWVERFWHNTERYVTREIPSAVLSSNVEDYSLPISTGEWLSALILLGIILFGWYHLRQYRLLILGYTLATFALLLIYPEVWTGNRLMLHLVPFFLFCGVYGLYFLLKLGLQRINIHNRVIIQTVLPLLFLLLVPSFVGQTATETRPGSGIKFLRQMARIPGYDPAHENYFQAASWIKENAPKGSMIICRKPSLFAVFSGSYVSNYRFTENQKDFLEYLRQRKTNFVVLDALGYSSTPRYLFPVVQANPDKFEIVLQLQNPDTYLCRFHDEFGWYGEYDQKGMPKGKGEYRFADGRKLIGTFNDGRMVSMTGTGTMYDANGKNLGNITFQNGQQVK
ncbi:MAG: glycosyltransferase family 39 protein [Siphonobacter sp.]